jgi:hypothetical protein
MIKLVDWALMHRLMRTKDRGYIIIDLDGCISNDKRRVQLYDAALFDQYHTLCCSDTLANQRLLERVKWHNHSFVVSTGRPDTYRAQTLAWLNGNYIYPWMLLMREAGNTTPTPNLKSLHALRAVDAHGEPLFAIDDRDDVLAMYKSMKLNAFKVTAY